MNSSELSTGALAVAILAAVVSLTGCTHETEAPLANSNVVLILVDTLRADHLGAFGHNRPTSPFLDRLAAESVTFTKVVAPASQTVPSMLSLWTGLYPSRHGNQYYGAARAFRVPTPKTKPRIPPTIPLLSEHLSERGYRSAAVVTNPWLREEYGFARGFEIYRHLDAVPAPRGPAINQEAKDILTKWRREKFFLYLHYMDVHIPFDPKPRYKADFSAPPGAPDGIAELASSYDAEIRAIDDYVRDMIQTVREVDPERQTLFIFASDHGEEFGDHGGLGHGHGLHRELLHVPVLLSHPKLAPWSRRIDTPISLVDLAPTIRELLFGDAGTTGDGISLLPLIRNGEGAGDERTLYSELGTMTAAQRQNKKLIRTRAKTASSEQAYDLATDPDEQRPVTSKEPWIQELSKSIDALNSRRFVEQGDFEPLDPATEERVRALGY